MACARDMIWYDENGTLRLLSSTQKPEPQSNQEKNTRQTQTEAHSTKYLMNTPQNCQDHKKQLKSEKLPQSRRH